MKFLINIHKYTKYSISKRPWARIISLFRGIRQGIMANCGKRKTKTVMEHQCFYIKHLSDLLCLKIAGLILISNTVDSFQI